jgi:hypothetical protein
VSRQAAVGEGEVPVEEVHPAEDNRRQELGDLNDLASVPTMGSWSCCSSPLAPPAAATSSPSRAVRELHRLGQLQRVVDGYAAGIKDVECRRREAQQG